MPWQWLRQRATRLTPGLALGERGEDLAARHLKRQGYKILVRRFKSRSGEIDLIARQGEWLVFVEVKTRSDETRGLPSESVDVQKQRHIARVALDYLRLLNNPELRFRFDIVEVILPAVDKQPTDIRVIRDAFELPSPYTY